MTRVARYPIAIRVLEDPSLAEFAKEEAHREGTNVSAVLRQSLAARRDRYLAKEREDHRHAKALHSAIEGDFERNTAGVN